MTKPARMSRSPSVHRKLIISTVLISIVTAYVVVLALWPLGAVAVTIQKQASTQARQTTLQWPAYGQSALYAEGYGMLGSSGASGSVPIASITKIITALTVLSHSPISSETSSPTIQFSDADMALYAKYLAGDGVVAPAVAGTSISQYDLMQIMLIASANNYAESLAVWSFGSVDTFLAAARTYLDSKGLVHTTIADTAGFTPGSASTASDLVLLGKLALENPIIAKIVAKPSVSIPGIGTFMTTNLLVGQGKAIGIKTGNTDEAGQCLLFANKTLIDGTSVTFIGAVLGGPSRLQVANDASALLASAPDDFSTLTYANPNESFATYIAPWGAKTQLIATEKASVLVWAGDTTKASVSAPNIKPGQSAVHNAFVNVKFGKINDRTVLKLSAPLAKPSIFWKLTHPLKVIYQH